MPLPTPTPSACVIIPALNEAKRIGEVVKKAREFVENVVVIDDGSQDDTSRIARESGALVIRNEINLGKGASLIKGFDYARHQPFDVVITLDADGQHDPAEIPRFLDTYQRTRIPVLIGNRMWNRASIPTIRRWTNTGMSRLLSRIMHSYLPDTQCGYRLYRGNILPYVPVASTHYAMESEILLQLALRGFRMDSIRIPVLYRGESSRIRPMRDAIRFFVMLLRFHHERRMRRA